MAAFRSPLVPDAIPMSFGDLRSAPDALSRQLVRLTESQVRVVTFSTRGGTSGNCGASLIIFVLWCAEVCVLRSSSTFSG